MLNGQVTMNSDALTPSSSNTGSQQRLQNHHLDFIEFLRAETEDAHNSDTHNRNIRKWQENKIVDLKVLKHYHQIIENNFNIIQEYILLGQIFQINSFTLYLPISLLFQNESISLVSSFISSLTRRPDYRLLYEKKKSLVDMKTLRALSQDKQINWSPTVSSLYPIMTLADGNCLCHAVLSYLTGMQDTVRDSF